MFSIHSLDLFLAFPFLDEPKETFNIFLNIQALNKTSPFQGNEAAPLTEVQEGLRAIAPFEDTSLALTPNPIPRKG